MCEHQHTHTHEISLLNIVSWSCDGAHTDRRFKRQQFDLLSAYSMTLTSVAGAMKLTLRCDPSQNGFFLPEAMNIVRETNFASIFITGTIVVSFFLFHILDRAIVIHAIPLGHSSDEDLELGAQKGQMMSGSIRAAGLSIHSFLDGVAIGTAFHLGINVGVIIGLAVIFHDFSDGLNTVTVMRRAGSTGRPSLLWLLVDALTPMAGALVALVIYLSPETLAVMLAFFVGAFLFITASDLLSEAHRRGTLYRVMLASLLGVLLIFTVTRFLNI